MPDTPVIVMLGLFYASMRQVSAISVADSYTVHLDVIGSKGTATPLGVITHIDATNPVLKLALPHGIWASEPAVRWHVIRQAQHLWRAHRKGVSRVGA